jgi:hypothetical protein
LKVQSGGRNGWRKSPASSNASRYPLRFAREDGGWRDLCFPTLDHPTNMDLFAGTQGARMGHPKFSALHAKIF